MTDYVAIILEDGDRRTPVMFQTPQWDASMDWARFHGLDPMRIPAGSTVIRDAAKCEIRYERIAKDADGDLIIQGDDWLTEPIVERGEAPPLPFPVAS